MDVGSATTAKWPVTHGMVEKIPKEKGLTARDCPNDVEWFRS
jgi:hypothetical protein